MHLKAVPIIAISALFALGAAADPAGAQQTGTRQAAGEAGGDSVPIAAWNLRTGADEAAGSQQQRGKAVFDNWCHACHSRNPLNSGTASLAVKYNGTVPAALEDRTDLLPEAVRAFVRNGVAMMPGFRKVEISDEDLEALTAYLARKP